MKNKYAEGKALQLGMDLGTASNKLKKKILLHFIQKLALDLCFQCRLPITAPEVLSIEHKVPWLNSPNPTTLFFDLNNIAFSHLACNASRARRPLQKYFTPTARKAANREIRSRSMRLNYSPAKRRAKYERTGH